MLDNKNSIASRHVLTTTGTDAPAIKVQSLVAEGVRAVAATGADGESRTWYETFNDQTETWVKTSSTLALDSDTFETGNSIIIEEDEADGLQIRIETRVTRGLYF